MTSLKSLGSTFSPQSPALRTAVERPVEQARPEARTAALHTRDEYVPEKKDALNKALLGGLESATPTVTEAATALGELAADLEPFRSALDNIVGQIDPAVLDNPGKLNQFILDAIKALGIDEKHIGDAMKYVDRLYAYNQGNTRLV